MYTGSAPERSFAGKYSDFLDEGEREVESQYHYVHSINSRGEFITRVFFPETRQITSLTTYKNARRKKKHGIERKWYDNGARRSEGQYIDGEMTGEWAYYSYYYDRLSELGEYQNGKKEGLWKSYDSESGLIREELTYKYGLRDGPFIIYDSLANVVNQGVYRLDTIYEQTNPQDVSEEMPYMSSCKGIEPIEERTNCSEEKLLFSLYRNIRYPALARDYGIEGMAIVQFVINADGSVTDVTVVSGLCESISRECIKTIGRLPTWEPGTQNGKAVNVSFTIPIRFRLE